MTTTTKRTLVWSEEGQIGCTLPTHAPYPGEEGQIGCTLPTHAPYPGSDTWRSGRWRPITLSEAIDFEAEVGHAPECETCKSIARRAAR